MQEKGVHTAHNVLIDYEVAGLGERIGAFLLDWILQVVYIFLLGYVNLELLTLPLWVNVLLALPVFLYHLLFEIFFNGQSPGKRQLKIKVVRLDATAPRFGNYFLRWILRPVDIWLSGSVAVLSILMSVRGQRLGDKAAGTTVVKYRTQLPPDEQPLINTDLSGDHRLTFPQVERLYRDDIEHIHKALQNYRRTADPHAVEDMALKMKKRIEVETEMPPVEFLKTIIKDYQFLTSRV